jgi:hypothetical protein
MMEKAVELRLNAAWYVILETDTYVFWENLFELLSDDKFYPLYELPYLGVTVYGTHGRQCAQGGSGFLVSHVAAEMLVVCRTELAGSLWSHPCCKMPKICWDSSIPSKGTSNVALLSQGN